eukprot:TRINITY_DN112881_c0_g1_i1.p1 TRINITY_DN112881_c0_g1~~TRINITY_DN112881_c0_g1_i1.p1  ORF type:complete len:119 (+),score=30.07 TRINITY_DN112881_c0_g1_i1:114-470(+)
MGMIEKSVAAMPGAFILAQMDLNKLSKEDAERLCLREVGVPEDASRSEQDTKKLLEAKSGTRYADAFAMAILTSLGACAIMATALTSTGLGDGYALAALTMPAPLILTFAKGTHRRSK